MAGFYIPLTREEQQALAVMAASECRDKRDQARYLICEALVEAGYLKPILPPYPSRPAKLKEVIWRHKHGEITLEEASEELGISRERFRQLEQRYDEKHPT